MNNMINSISWLQNHIHSLNDLYAVITKTYTAANSTTQEVQAVLFMTASSCTLIVLLLLICMLLVVRIVSKKTGESMLTYFKHAVLGTNYRH